MLSLYQTIFFAVLVGIAVGFATGYLGCYVRWLTTHRNQLDHEYRLSDLEARLNREVKVRAQAASLKSKDLDQQIIDLARNSQVAEKTPDLSLSDWRNKGYLRK